MAPGENGGEDMIIIACTDDNQGMLFNHRRQSQDRVQAEEFAGSSHEKITEEIYERVK